MCMWFLCHCMCIPEQEVYLSVYVVFVSLHVYTRTGSVCKCVCVFCVIVYLYQDRKCIWMCMWFLYHCTSIQEQEVYVGECGVYIMFIFNLVSMDSCNNLMKWWGSFAENLTPAMKRAVTIFFIIFIGLSWWWCGYCYSSDLLMIVIV